MNDDFLELDIAQIAKPGDVVRTIGKESLALIEWGDGSMTRLAGNTRISITRNDVSPDQTLIDISFELFSGKTWSQVVSFISEDSSFTQQFE
jgi:tRNA A37 threonylcarbamoyladenosine biosynthesis protein TsaE